MSDVAILDFDKDSLLDDIWRAYQTSRPTEVENPQKPLGGLVSPYWGTNYCNPSRVWGSGAGVGQRIYIGEREDGNNLSYLNARYYQANRGQFLSQDPSFLDIGGAGFEEKYERTLQQHLMNPQALNSYSYGLNNPIVNKDPEGEIVPLILAAWAVAEIGLTAYDAYNAYQTVNDPNASELDKSIALAGFAAGVIGPGGGYGAASKQVMQLYKQTNSAGQALMKGVNNTDVLKVIKDNYRAGATIGNGSTADAVRHEILTGQSVGGKFHSIKAQQQINRISNIFKNSGSGLSSHERKTLNTISNTLKNALKTKK